MAVLSTMPYSSVLSPLSQHAGPFYFNRGPSALQQVTTALQDQSPSWAWCHTTQAITHCSGFADHLLGAHTEAQKSLVLCCGQLSRPIKCDLDTSLKKMLVVQVYEEVQQWAPPSPGLHGMVPVGSMTIPAQVTLLVVLWPTV